MKKANNNKGVAMVTVLIAITFIALLASSLLLMAYMNYTTKAMRYSAVDDFYTNEYALDDLSTSLQQLAAEQTSVANAKTALATACGVTGTTGHKVYNGANVASNIRYAIQDPKIASITVDTVYDTSVSGNYVDAGTYVDLLGLKITTTTRDGYVSNIITDIRIYFPGSGTGDMDVNDFSIIGDGKLDVQHGIFTATGNIFCQAATGDAVTVGSDAVCTLLGKRGIIDGDVHVNGSGVLMITGEVAITGDLILDNKATLVVAGKLLVKGTQDLGTSTVIGSITSKSDMDVSQIPTDGLAKNIFTDVHMYNSMTHNWETFSYEDYMTKLNGDSHQSDSSPTETFTYTLAGTSYTYACRMGVDIGTINKASNSLVYTDKPVDVQGSGSLVNTTVLSTKATEYKVTGVSKQLGNMPDLAYELAKAHLITNSTGMSRNIGGWQPRYPDHGGSVTDEAGMLALIQKPDGSFYSTTEYHNNGGEYMAYDDHGTTRYAVWDGTCNYVPFGYFIRSDSSSYISSIFNSILGESDPTNTTCSYSNWSKE